MNKTTKPLLTLLEATLLGVVCAFIIAGTAYMHRVSVKDDLLYHVRSMRLDTLALTRGQLPWPNVKDGKYLTPHKNTLNEYGYPNDEINSHEGSRLIAVAEATAVDGFVILADGMEPELCAKFAPNYLRCVDDVTKYATNDAAKAVGE